MREIKFQGHIEATIKSLVPALDDRLDADIAIRLALNAPEQGQDTRATSSFPIYAVKISGTDTRPPLTVYYHFTSKLVLVVGVKITFPATD